MTSSSHRVQGLNTDEVAADWPPISAADIAWLSARYLQLGEHSQPRWHSPRPLSAAAIVDGVDGAGKTTFADELADVYFSSCFGAISGAPSLIELLAV